MSYVRRKCSRNYPTGCYLHHHEPVDSSEAGGRDAGADDPTDDASKYQRSDNICMAILMTVVTVMAVVTAIPYRLTMLNDRNQRLEIDHLDIQVLVALVVVIVSMPIVVMMSVPVTIFVVATMMMLVTRGVVSALRLLGLPLAGIFFPFTFWPGAGRDGGGVPPLAVIKKSVENWPKNSVF